MIAKIRWRYLVLLVAAILPIVGLDPAVSDSSGSTLTETGEVTWTGGPFLIPASPVYGVTNGCLGGQDSTCVYYSLTADASYGKSIQVTVGSSRSDDDIDLYILDRFGNELAQSRRPSGLESVVFVHRGGTLQYTVAVAPWKVSVDSTYTGTARIADLNPASDVECSEQVPEAAGVRGLTDDGGNIDINVLVLMHGTSSQAQASSVFGEAQNAFAPLGITLKPSYQIAPTSHFGPAATTYRRAGSSLLWSTKSYLGGVVPEGIDIAYLLTDVEIFHNGYDHRGIVDCIGGMANPARSFAAGSLPRNLDGSPNTRVAVRIMAHEIGHLLGGRHEHSNCVEGDLPGGLSSAISICTTMFETPGLRSLNFGFLAGALIREHAVRYGRAS